MRNLLLRMAVAIVVLAATTASGAIAGRIDTFQDGTTNNWFAGGGPFGQVPPAPPQVIATGGPAGTGDQFLLVSALGGSGPGSRLVAINQTQWAGDYVGVGLLSIEMDLINLGTSDLSIRLQLSDGAGGPPTNQAVTTSVALLPAASGWMHAIFSVESLDLTALLGDPTALLSDVTELRIIHSPTPASATSITGQLGLDNIETSAMLSPPTVAVGEPVTLALFGGALLGFLGLRRRDSKIAT